MSDEARWLSTKEASARLGVTLRSLYRFIDDGDLTAYKFGRVIRLRERDVDRFIEQCRIAPGDLEHLLPARRGGEDEVSAGHETRAPETYAPEPGAPKPGAPKPSAPEAGRGIQ